MRQAKQLRAETVTNNAVNMISERGLKTVTRQNDETDHGIERAVEHARNMYKDRAAEVSLLVRKGNSGPSDILYQTPTKFKAAGPSGKSNKPFVESATNTRRLGRNHRDISDNAGQSIPTHIRKAMDANGVEGLAKKNPEDPKLLVQNGQSEDSRQRRVNSDGQVLVKMSPPVGGQMDMKARSNPANNTAVVKKTMVAHGVPSNPMAEARRRRALDNKIRELSRQ